MELRFEAHADDMELLVLNEQQTVTAMGVAQKRVMLARLAAGLGANAPLPRPKDGGKALERSGTLTSAIDVAVTQDKRGRFTSFLRAYGDRPANENVQVKKAAARDKTKELRAAMAVALTLQTIAGGTAPSWMVRRKVGRDGSHFALGKIRVRTADTNAALAGILSVPPKDQRSINGGRGIYRVFEKAPVYEEAAAEAARRTLVAMLVQKAK